MTMINVPYLLKILGTNDLKELVANLDLAPIDINAAIWGAEERGEIRVDEENGTVELTIEPTATSNPELEFALTTVFRRYASRQKNVTRGLLNNWVKDSVTGQGYGWHDYITTVQFLIDGGVIKEYVVDVPAKYEEKTVGKKTKRTIVRPAHKFVFLGLTENEAVNEEWNAAAVNKWIEDYEKVG